MSNHVPWLTVVLFIPAGAALLLQLIPRDARGAVKALTVTATGAAAVLVGVLIASIPHTAGSGAGLTVYYQERLDWITLGNDRIASYHVGLDGMSAWLLALNAGVFLVGALAVSARATERLKFYCGLMLLVETATTGVLLSLDLLLFYLFWEGMLVPLYFLLANFGSEKRGPATLKFIVYTVAGSLLMLVAIIYLAFLQERGVHSFDLQQLVLNLPPAQSRLVIPGVNISTFTPAELAFICFTLAFAIKIPIVPFHTWLPDLYESQPPSTLTFFAGVVSKMGAYGFIRFGLTLFPEPVHYFKWLLAALAVLSIIYGALMALSERDIKRIVAYASISHLGFIALGIFTLTDNGLNGAIIQIINHGIIIAALFLIAGMVEARTGTRNLQEIAGLEKRMPWLYFFFLVATLAGLGMPGMNSFVGEFTILLGAFQLNWIYAVLAGGGVVLACWYMLRLHQGVMHNALRHGLETVSDLRLREGLLLAPLAALMIFLGVFPRPIGDVAKPAVTQYVGLSQEPAQLTGTTPP
jgi:NADH-quinone oxidoreductase subunit M